MKNPQVSAVKNFWMSPAALSNLARSQLYERMTTKLLAFRLLTEASILISCLSPSEWRMQLKWQHDDLTARRHDTPGEWGVAISLPGCPRHVLIWPTASRCAVSSATHATYAMSLATSCVACVRLETGLNFTDSAGQFPRHVTSGVTTAPADPATQGGPQGPGALVPTPNFLSWQF